MFRTTLQGLLVFGWVLVATRIVLTFYPPEEWGKTAVSAATDTTAVTSSPSSPAASVPVVAENSTQPAAQ